MADFRGRCPKCGYIFEFASNPYDEKLKPKSGDISFCLNCGQVNQFDEFGVKEVDESKLPEEARKEIAEIFLEKDQTEVEQCEA